MAESKVGQPVSRRLGDLLGNEGLITHENLQRALGEQKGSNEKLGSILVRLGLIQEDQLIGFLSRQYGIPSITLSQLDIAPEVVKLVPAQIAKKYEVLPVKRTGNALTLAMADPTNVFALDDVAFMTNLQVLPVVASQGAIRQTIERLYEPQASAFSEVITAMEGEAPDVELVEGGEDVAPSKIDIFELKDASEEAPGAQRGSPPQAGRTKSRLSSREIDLRVSTLPTIFGEKIVMRILDKEALTLDLAKLGFDDWSMENFKKVIHQPYGMILIPGPTGSGKTTTLYSAVHTINSPDINIMTAEDPVEYNLKGINQVQVNEEIGRTFSAVLRSFLRQDPDVILVGETRDLETAQIAIRAALTGHLVFSTLHTNDEV